MSFGNPLILSDDFVNGYFIKNMKNLITDENELLQLAAQNKIDLSRVPGFDPNTIDGINTGFNMALTNVPSKIGCCLRDVNDNTPKTAKIRKQPTRNAYVNDDSQHFGFSWDNNFYVGVCPANLYKGSIDCDTFYNIYCANVKKVFTDRFGKWFDGSDGEFIDYAPECACYANLTIGQQSYPSDIPPACYKLGCAVSGSPSYPDPVSRTEPCNATICSTIFNASDIKARSVINSTIVQECGEPPAVSKTKNNFWEKKTNTNTENNNKTKTETENENKTNTENENKTNTKNENTNSKNENKTNTKNENTNSKNENTNSKNENVNNETKSETNINSTNMIIFGIISCCCFLSIILIFYMFMKRRR
jgi:hypothetical protein